MENDNLLCKKIVRRYFVRITPFILRILRKFDIASSLHIATNLEGIFMVPFEAKTRQMYHYKLSHCDYSGWGWVSKIVGGLSKLGRGVVKLWG